ncbi:DUF6364 family protein [Nonlabens sp.]|uniref:DUF6364 family protein n=1 Tax=Nonlabens sp. TaxID=1888209 RepID=UPI003F69BBC3
MKARIVKTKLTLTIEKAVIEHAKQYAKDTGQSLSELIQNYLNRLAIESVETKKWKLFTSDNAITTFYFYLKKQIGLKLQKNK